MSRSVRTGRRRGAAARRSPDVEDVDARPDGGAGGWPPSAEDSIRIEPAPPSAPRPTPGPDSVLGPASDPVVDLGDPPGRALRWSRALAGQLRRLPLIGRLDQRVAPVIDNGRLDRTDALAGLIRFGLMGGLATLVYFALAIALYRTSVGPNTTSAVAIAVSVAVSFVLQSRVTFQSGRFDRAEAMRFVVVGLIGLTVSRVVIGTVYLGAGQPYWVAALVVCVVVPVANFAAMNFWVFAGGRRRRG